MRTIKFRGRDMNGHFVYGLLTKKKIRSSGEIRWAIATGNCTAGETVPVNENSIAQLVGYDSAGNEVYEGDTVTITRSTQTYKVGTEFTVRRGAYVVDDIRSIMHFISEDFKLKET